LLRPPQATENCGNTLHLTHLGAQDYDAGWNNGGNWANYTRRYPAGIFYVFLRGSSTSQQQRNADLSMAGGTGALTGSGTLAFRSSADRRQSNSQKRERQSFFNDHCVVKIASAYDDR